MKGKKLRLQDIKLIRSKGMNPGEFRLIEETKEKIVYINILHKTTLTIKKKTELDHKNLQ